MCSKSSKVIAVTDSSKIGHRGYHKIIHHTNIDTLVTDTGLPKDYASELEEAKVKVVYVDSD